MQRPMTFATYARDVLNAVAFEPDFERPDEQVFAASLASIRDLARGWIGRRNALGARLDIEAGFVERMTPNALADHHGGRHVIVMHQALMATIVDLCLFLFTQACVFPSIGDAEGETSPRYHGADVPGLFLLRTTLAGGVIDPAVDHARVPRDAERHVAAIYMAMLMSRYVWLHELAHCAQGHVLLLKTHEADSPLDEVTARLDLVGIKSRDRFASLHGLRRSLELEADAVALDELLAVQLDGRENIPGLQAHGDEARMTMALLGAALMTWLFEEYQSFMDAQHGLSHPTPAQRLGHMIHHMRAMRSVRAQHVDALLRQLAALSGCLPGFDQIQSALIDHDPEAASPLPAELDALRFR
ncbi:MAG: hypothetical protein K2X00_17600 [Nitrospiraceae bacterium]|nr:hypothetical protein [Nitrospiraceae bacterium]